MTHINLIGRMGQNLIAPLNRTRRRAMGLERTKSPRRRALRLEMLEDRCTPSVTSVFELDGNTATTTTHDWDQVFADNNTTPPPVSSALASAFVTDKFNSNTDDIFTGGGSKDVHGIQDGPWLFTASKPQ